MVQKSTFFVGLAGLLVAGCVSTPTAPTIAVMPAQGKPFEVFRQEQAYCMNHAAEFSAGGVQQANDRAAGAGLLATGLGALVGVAIDRGRSAEIGAATGAVVGAGAGARVSGRGQYSVQQIYNMAYAQCMSSYGNQVAGYGARRAARWGWY